MSTAAFSIPSDPHARISITRRSKGPGTATSNAADEALRRIIDERRRRHRQGGRSAPPSSALQTAVASVTSPVRATVDRLGWARFLFTAGILAGCGLVLAIAVVRLTEKRSPCPVYRVTGRLTVGKTVPFGAQIMLMPKAGSLPEDAVPQAVVRDDGSFVFGTFDREDGVPAGDYVAVVQWFRVARDGSGGANVLPRKYASPATSPLLVSVKEGANEPIQLVIVR